ncbi:hypothetical protein JCM16303_004861 [Sporobolomyces ruberrimus]
MRQSVLTTWARLLALTSATYALWASAWAIAYRKFFWDFIDGDLRSHGIVPSPKFEVLIRVIVEYPIVQIVNIILALLILALEFPVPFLRHTKLYRSISFKIGFNFLGFCCAMFLYQTVNGGIFFLITSLVYFVAFLKGEAIEDDEKKGTGKGKSTKVGTVQRI